MFHTNHSKGELQGGVTMLTKSRWRTCKSSGGSGRLGSQAVEDGSDTCRGAGDAYGVRYS